MATGKVDKPKIHATLASLDVEADPEPFVYATKTGKRIAFPDPGAMEAFEAEEFLGTLSTARNSVIFERWLAKDQFAALKAEKLSLRQLLALVRAVQKHYEDIFGGDEGEGDASTDS